MSGLMVRATTPVAPWRGSEDFLTSSMVEPDDLADPGGWRPKPVHVLLAPDDEDALAGVAVGVRVFQDVEQVATLDMEDDVLEPDAALRFELRVLRVVPVEVLRAC